MTDHQGVLLSGHIYFADDTKPFTGTLRVVLEDVGRMDVAAPVIAESTQENFRYEGKPVSYTLRGDVPTDGAHRLNVRVHVSRDGSEDFKSGDYITTESYPALTPGSPSQLDVKVQAI
jgi:hypothetical protein